MVTGWLAADSRPLGTILGRRVTEVETFTGNDGQPVYYFVHLDPFGFVIVPADDLVEPIIGFADSDAYDLSTNSPLAALVATDLTGRIEAASAAQGGMMLLSVSDTQNKWHHFIELAEGREDGFAFMGISSISDVRVAPLIESKWSQNSLYPCGLYCYNYYTPNHYLSGCVSTAMAQLMRYYCYPTGWIGVHDFTIEVQGNQRTAYTRGGDGHGGPYMWANMVLVPDCSTTEAQRQAIGALCFDASVSVGTDYGTEGSSADVFDAKDALIKTFQYANAIRGFNEGVEIGPGLTEMINPNLDAKYPVILGLVGAAGHGALVDGYGYNASTLYHHLNMGWAGLDDVWYNLPDVSDYDTVMACIYNVFTDGTGEIISGRVTNAAGNPIESATVTAQGLGSPRNVTTDAKGIYAIVKLSSSSNFTVRAAKTGYLFKNQTVRTGASRDWANTSGNRWKIDFVGAVAGDWDRDNIVDLADFATFALAWRSRPSSKTWSAECDISSPPDNIIDILDLAVFAGNWLTSLQ